MRLKQMCDGIDPLYENTLAVEERTVHRSLLASSIRSSSCAREGSAISHKLHLGSPMLAGRGQRCPRALSGANPRGVRSLPVWRCRMMSTIAPGIGALRPVVGAVLILATAAVAAAEPCNPAIYGRLCETQTPQPKSQRPPAISLPPVQSIGSDQWVRQDRPATFGAITFQGGKQCIGLLRRANCN